MKKNLPAILPPWVAVKKGFPDFRHSRGIDGDHTFFALFSAIKTPATEAYSAKRGEETINKSAAAADGSALKVNRNETQSSDDSIWKKIVRGTPGAVTSKSHISHT